MDRLVRIQDSRGAQKRWIFDNAGRMIKEIDAVGNEEHITYDNNRNIVKVDSYHKEPSGDTKILSKEFAYDSRNRRIKIIEPDGSFSLENWDDRNLLVSFTSKMDIITKNQYNSFGEKIREIFDEGQLEIIKEWQYDSMGRLIGYKDPSGQNSKYSFDSIGKLEKTEYPNGFISQRTYNTRGLVVKEELNSGVVLEYMYDHANRLKTLKNTNSPLPILRLDDHNFKYDGLNRIIEASNGSNQVLRTYDSLNRLNTEQTNGDVIQLIYNDILGFADKVWSDGRTERYRHNLNGIVSSIEQISNGLLGSTNGIIAKLSPSGPSHFALAECKNDFRIGASYDDRKRLSELTINNGAMVNKNLKYRYDTANRRIVEGIVGSSSKISLHSFDNKNRLLNSKHGVESNIPNALSQSDNDDAISFVKGNSGTFSFEESFTYNNSDERLKYTETGTPDKDYTYLSGHKIHSDGINTHTFYTDGTERSDGTLDFKVDAMGRVVNIEKEGVSVFEIEYDAFGRPSNIQQDSAKKLSFNYFGNHIEQENLDGVPFRQITQNPINGAPLAYHSASSLNYLVFDGRFNLIGFTNEDGILLETYEYKSFGLPSIFRTDGVKILTSDFGVNPIFGGQRFFNTIGLYLSKRRLLNPIDGIYMSSDPYGYADSSSLYVYVGQNPIDFIDPDGELAILATILIGAAVGAAISAVANWDKEGADFWVSVGAGAVAGGIMGTGAGLLSFAAGGAVGGAIVGGYENGVEGAITQGLIGAAGGLVGGAIGGRLATSVSGRIATSSIARSLSSRAASTIASRVGGMTTGQISTLSTNLTTQASQYIGVSVGGASAGFSSTATQQSLGYISAGENPLNHLGEIANNSISGAGYGLLGGVANKGLIQGYSYYRHQSYGGMIGAEGEFYVQNQTLQRMNTRTRVPNVNGNPRHAKIPDLYGRIIGDVKNTSQIPSLNAQNYQLASINQAALNQGQRMQIFHRPGVTAGPRSQVARNPNIDLVPIRQHTPPFNPGVSSK